MRVKTVFGYYFVYIKRLSVWLCRMLKDTILDFRVNECMCVCVHLQQEIRIRETKRERKRERDFGLSDVMRENGDLS